ncbi:MAG: prephenate dehydratase [Alphaproteobacteria bacterium]|nr:prephenate dehydratase [Alphaproteobacteria bacterium]
MKVAYQGEPGAFGHEACLTFLPDYEAVRKRSFADVFDAVAAGETELGVLPEENSAAGIVPEVKKLLDRGGLNVIARHLLPVRMHLLGIEGATLDRIRLVVSHPIAIAQCAETLKALGLPTEEALNTAGAAKALAEAGDSTRAVLASAAAASTYGLAILRPDMQDLADNATRFVVLSRGPLQASH